MPIGQEEPEAAAVLLDWLAERRRIARGAVEGPPPYRKAEDVDEHLTRIPVPPFTRRGDWPDPTPTTPP